jgi:multidrug efflux pump subunit AcrA (membrane-fusion protein)
VAAPDSPLTTAVFLADLRRSLQRAFARHTVRVMYMTEFCTARPILLSILAAMVAVTAACQARPPADRVRVSGQVEATDVQVASQVAGRLLERKVAEGDKVQKGAVVALLDTADTELALTRARAEHAQADAQLRLLLAGSRPEDIRVAESQIRRRRQTSPQRMPTSRPRNSTFSGSSSCSRRTRAHASSSTTQWRDATSRVSAPWPPASACASPRTGLCA